MTVTVSCEIESTNGCCGVRQITNFSGGEEYGDVRGRGKTEEEAWADLFTEITTRFQNHMSAAVAQIWFVKYRDCDGNFEDEYRAEPLRLLVEAMSGVIELGEYHNPNSGNIIKGYQWTV